jgi:SOS-response transcriptional repressor LexA
MMRNEAGVAPSHADFQRFFNLTPPSVNSMLIRLEQRGFIRRVPGRARAIELTINLDRIPSLDRMRLRGHMVKEGRTKPIRCVTNGVLPSAKRFSSTMMIPLSPE